METKKIESRSSTNIRGNANRDVMTGEPGAHPVGVGTGATGGGIAGAVIGAAVGGPIGAGVGAVVGVISGGLTGKSVAEAINPTDEHKFWRGEFQNRPYFTSGTPYDQYGPAFQYGWESYANHKGQTFHDVETELARDWENHRGTSKLSWNYSKGATQDGWHRAEQSIGGKCQSGC